MTTYHVRTPAGERRYHRPIGAPIGGGDAKKAAGVVKLREPGTVKSTPHKAPAMAVAPVMRETPTKVGKAEAKIGKPAKVKVKAPKTEKAPKETPRKVQLVDPHDIEHQMHFTPSAAMRARRARKSRKDEPAVHIELPDPNDSPEAIKMRREVLGDQGGDSVNANLWQLSPKALTEAINNPHTPKERLVALKREQAARVVKVRELLGQHDAGKKILADAKKNHEDPGKVFAKLEAASPRFIAHELERIRTTGNKIRDIDHLEKVFDAFWDWLFKGVAGALMTIIGLKFGGGG